MNCDAADRADKIPEIEITPEMIEAGIEEYALFSFADPGEWVVSAIYRAMEKRRRAYGNGGAGSIESTPSL